MKLVGKIIELVVNSYYVLLAGFLCEDFFGRDVEVNFKGLDILLFYAWWFVGERNGGLEV